MVWVVTMLCMNLSVDASAKARDDDFLQHNPIQERDHENVEDKGERDFVRQMCRVGEQMQVLFPEPSFTMSVHV